MVDNKGGFKFIWNIYNGKVLYISVLYCNGFGLNEYFIFLFCMVFGDFFDFFLFILDL